VTRPQGHDPTESPSRPCEHRAATIVNDGDDQLLRDRYDSSSRSPAGHLCDGGVDRGARRERRGRPWGRDRPDRQAVASRTELNALADKIGQLCPESRYWGGNHVDILRARVEGARLDFGLTEREQTLIEGDNTCNVVPAIK